MQSSVSKTLKVLADVDAGWVNRRDAAVELGQGAVEAVRGLKTHEKEPDRDVQESIARSLQDVAKAAAGIDLDAPSGGMPSLQKLVEALESKGSRDVTKSGDTFEITVVTDKGRSQKVYVEAAQSNTKRDIIRVTTRCARAEEKAYEWALTNNSHMSHCSLAIEIIDGDPWLVLVNSLLADSVSFAELKLTVKEVAFYGDWVEDKLTGEDVN
jgi:hypothetical protein